MTTIGAVSKAMLDPSEESIATALSLLEAEATKLGPTDVEEALAAGDLLVELEEKRRLL